MAIDKIVIQYEAQVAEFKKELDGIKKQLKGVESTAADSAKKTGKALDDSGTSANKFKETLKDVGKSIAAAFAVQQIVSFGREAVKAASAFEKSMGNVATLVDTNVESIDAMGQSVRQIAARTPVELGQLSSALYDVRSAGVSAEDAMAVLESSAQLGVAGLSTTAEAANIMTSAVNAFAAEGLSAEQISDILFKTVKSGKTTLAELSQAFGANAGTIAEAGVSLADFQAATAALTTTGQPASQAQNQLRAAMNALLNPSSELEAIYAKLNVTGGRDLLNSSENLGDAFSKVTEVAAELGVETIKVFGGAEANSAIIGVASTVNETYTATLADMTTGANAVNVAFEKQAQTADAQFQLMQNAFEDVKIEIGNALMPVLLDAAEGLRDFMGGIDEDTIRNLGKALAIAAAGFAGFKFGQLVKGLAATVQGMKGVTFSVQGLSKAVAANPFGLIATAVATLVAYGPDLIDMFSGVTDLQKELEETSAKATENLRKEQGELNLVAEALKKTNPESEERAKLLKRFNELSPVAIEDLKDEAKFNNQLQSALDNANASFAQRIKLRAAEAVAQKASEKQIEAEAQAISLRTDILSKTTGVNAKLLDEFEKQVKTGKVSIGFWGGVPGALKEVAKSLGMTEAEARKVSAQAVINSDVFENYADALELSAEAGKEFDKVQAVIQQSSKEIQANVISRTKDEEKLMGLEAKRAYFGQKLTKEEQAEYERLTAAINDNTDATEDAAKKRKEINAQFKKEMISLADELTLMMIADEDEKSRKQLELQKAADLRQLEASEFSAEQKGQLKAKIEEKYNQLETTRQQAQNEKLKKADEDYRRFLEKQGMESEQDAKAAEDRKYSAYLELWEKRQENELLGIQNEKQRKLRELEIHEQNEIAKVEASEYAAQIIAEIQKKYAAKRVEVEKQTQKETNMAIADGLAQLASGFGSMVSSFAAVSGESAEYVKALSVVQVGIQTAVAIANAIAGATAAAAATGPGAPFAIAGYIASMIGTVVGAFAQVNQLLTAEVPKPGFFEGTPYLQLGGNPSGKDTIPVMAHEGEAIIPTKKNLQYPGLAKSWIDGSLDGYIHNQFVRPALMEQQQKAEEDFADRLAASMALQMSSQFDDYRLHRDMKEQTAVLRNGFYHLKENRKKIRGGR